jgi:hypothetical protein
VLSGSSFGNARFERDGKCLWSQRGVTHIKWFLIERWDRDWKARTVGGSVVCDPLELSRRNAGRRKSDCAIRRLTQAQVNCHIRRIGCTVWLRFQQDHWAFKVPFLQAYFLLIFYGPTRLVPSLSVISHSRFLIILLLTRLSNSGKPSSLSSVNSSVEKERMERYSRDNR